MRMGWPDPVRMHKEGLLTIRGLFFCTVNGPIRWEAPGRYITLGVRSLDINRKPTLPAIPFHTAMTLYETLVHVHPRHAFHLPPFRRVKQLPKDQRNKYNRYFEPDQVLARYSLHPLPPSHGFSRGSVRILSLIGRMQTDTPC